VQPGVSMSVSSQDPVSSLLERPDAGWSLTVYPGAREAGGGFRSSYRPPHRVGVRGQAVDPERSRAEAGRRARGKLRRYGAQNGLNRLGTLTYEGAGCHDPREVRAHVGEFFRALREGTGGKAFPYIWVPEWHPGGHGLHVHFVVGDYIKRGIIKKAWGRGIIDIRLIGDLGIGEGRLGEARKAAGYISKYVAKSIDDDRPAGLHRYDLAERFQPTWTRVVGRSADEVFALASDMFNAEPSYRWSSAQVPDWRGGLAIWGQWS
jgi:hypothetical protein